MSERAEEDFAERVPLVGGPHDSEDAPLCGIRRVFPIHEEWDAPIRYLHYRLAENATGAFYAYDGIHDNS